MSELGDLLDHLVRSRRGVPIISYANRKPLKNRGRRHFPKVLTFAHRAIFWLGVG
jgi:hypothetical protein